MINSQRGSPDKDKELPAKSNPTAPTSSRQTTNNAGSTIPKTKTPGHTRKKSHQDYLLRLENDLPSHIKNNIKNLIATRLNTADNQQPTGKTIIRLGELNFRKNNSLSSSKNTLKTFQRQAAVRASILKRSVAAGSQLILPCPLGSMADDNNSFNPYNLSRDSNNNQVMKFFLTNR